jgi:hypothetical protein
MKGWMGRCGGNDRFRVLAAYGQVMDQARCDVCCLRGEASIVYVLAQVGGFPSIQSSMTSNGRYVSKGLSALRFPLS